jgi:hypothetical protein
MYTGEVKVCKMPPMLNPLRETESAPPTANDAGKDIGGKSAAPAKVNSREGTREQNAASSNPALNVSG